jgi:hypothetical protein
VEQQYHVLGPGMMKVPEQNGICKPNRSSETTLELKRYAALHFGIGRHLE